MLLHDIKIKIWLRTVESRSKINHISCQKGRKHHFNDNYDLGPVGNVVT